MTPAEADLASLRRVCDRAEERRHARHDALSSVCAAGLDDTRARARLDRVRAVCDDLTVMRDEAFAVVAAERAAASPVRLVPRELTDDEAASLATAERDVRIVRDCVRIASRSLWEAQGRLLAAIASGDSEAEARAWTRLASDHDDAVAFDEHLAAAIAARAPLLAARWQEVAS